MYSDCRDDDDAVDETDVCDDVCEYDDGAVRRLLRRTMPMKLAVVVVMLTCSNMFEEFKTKEK